MYSGLDSTRNEIGSDLKCDSMVSQFGNLPVIELPLQLRLKQKIFLERREVAIVQIAFIHTLPKTVKVASSER